MFLHVRVVQADSKDSLALNGVASYFEEGTISFLILVFICRGVSFLLASPVKITTPLLVNSDWFLIKVHFN